MKSDYEVENMVNEVTRMLSKIGHPIPAWFTDPKKLSGNTEMSKSDKNEFIEAMLAVKRNIYAKIFSSNCAEEFGFQEGEPVFIYGDHALCASVKVVTAFIQAQIESVILEQAHSMEAVYKFYVDNETSENPSFILNIIREGFTDIANQIASGEPLIKPVMH